jgi:hypothetical protein
MHQFQVPLDDKIAFLREALAKNELLDYMLGAKGHEYVCPYADVPTYHAEVFDSLVGYASQSQDDGIWSCFISSLLAISANPTYSWFTLYYVSAYLGYFNQQDEPIALDTIMPKLTANIQANKSALSKDQRWMGRGFPNGLWDNATSMAAILNRDLGLSIMLE